MRLVTADDEMPDLLLPLANGPRYQQGNKEEIPSGDSRSPTKASGYSYVPKTYLRSPLPLQNAWFTNHAS
jgi:hypothetical protein